MTELRSSADACRVAQIPVHATSAEHFGLDRTMLTERRADSVATENGVSMPPPLPACLSFQLPRSTSRVRVARCVVGAWLRHRCRMPEDRAETAELILSELVTNAIQHGRSRQIAVRANMPAAGTVHVEVDDFTPSAAPQPSNASADEENGRGLWLVDHLAQELGGTYGHSRDGTVAWCRVPLQEPPNH